jgi:hypothetical protein
VTDDSRQRALAVLCSPDLASIVELVAWSPSPDTYEVMAVDGHVRFERRREDGRFAFTSTTIAGRDLLADQDPARFSPLEAELGTQQPDRSANSYPYAYEHIAQIWDHACAPDLCVVHTAAHRHQTHRGEHGSLGIVQARAPFIASGAGIRRDGVVDRHCRLIDIAPTILALLDVPTITGIGPTGEPVDGLHLSRQDGQVIAGLIDPSEAPPERVVGILLDGANANVLYDAAGAGEAPNVARLMAGGTTFAQGAFASLPTVTLPNHTAILTGCHPGHHGVLHNGWFDRALGRQVITESRATWQEAMQWLNPGIDTIHSALKRARPEALTVSVNETADAGADYSTFEIWRRGEARRLIPDLGSDVPAHATGEWYSASTAYRFGTLADVVALEQATAIWSGRHLGVDYATPTFTWVALSLTDAAFHEGGPHSAIARAAVRDTDARIGALLSSVEQAGCGDGTAFLVVADHGMEHNDADVTGDWGDALHDAGVVFRDEMSGFLYLDLE